METNEIVNNAEAMEVIPEIAAVNSGKSMKAVAGGLGLVVLMVGGTLIYKHAVKPMIAKAKAKKDEQKATEKNNKEREIDIDEDDDDE